MSNQMFSFESVEFTYNQIFFNLCIIGVLYSRILESSRPFNFNFPRNNQFASAPRGNFRKGKVIRGLLLFDMMELSWRT